MSDDKAKNAAAVALGRRGGCVKSAAKTAANRGKGQGRKPNASSKRQQYLTLLAALKTVLPRSAVTGSSWRYITVRPVSPLILELIHTHQVNATIEQLSDGVKITIISRNET